MGRPGKYLTHEERLRARRQQRLASVREARAEENRRSYEKVRLRTNADVTVPDSVRECASSPMAFRDEAIVAQFRAGPCTLSFGEREIGDKELHILTFGLLRYTLGMIDLPADFEEYWDDLSAALYGYQIRAYMEQQIALLTHLGARSRLEFSDYLTQQYRELVSRWEALAELVARLADEDNRAADLVSRHNMWWTAQQIIFAHESIQALSQADAVFVSTLNDRHRYLGSLYR